MHGGYQVNINSTKFVYNMGKDICDVIDDRVVHMLMKVENSTTSDVVDELTLDSDIEELLEMRKNLFELVKEKMEYELRKCGVLGEEEDSGLSIANRTRRSQPISVAKEVVEEYKYVVGLVNHFPRTLLSKESKYMDILPPEKELVEEDRQNNPITDKVRIAELSVMIKDQQKVIDSILATNEDQKRLIENLDQKVNELQEQIKIKKIASPYTKVNKEIQQGINKYDTFLDNYPPELLDSLLGSQRKKTNQDTTTTPVKTSPAKVSHVLDSGGNNVTVLHKAKHLPRVAVEDIIQGKQPMIENYNTPSEWPALPRKQNINNIGYYPDKPSAHNNRPSGDNNEERFRRTTPLVHPYREARKTKGAELTHGQRSGTGPQQELPQAVHRLRGRSEEQACTLYLKNICVEDKDSDADIMNMVKNHANEKNMRIMSMKVMRYKSVQDVVGCRIVVPEAMEYKLTSSYFWPEGVSCRRWEDAKSWYGGMKNDRYMGNNYNDKGKQYNEYNNSYERNDPYPYSGYGLNENWE